MENKQFFLSCLGVLCLTGVAVYWINNSYKLSLVNTEVRRVQAEVDKTKAEEGFKFKFGLTKDN